MLDRAVVIAVEGVDLAGKTTAISYASTILERAGFKTLTIKRPGPVARERLERWRDEDGGVSNGRIRLAMRQDAREALGTIRALPSPRNGGPDIVFLDRHWLSAVVKQGEPMEAMVERFGQPDLWVILHVDTDVALRRAAARGEVGGLDEDAAAHATLRAQYARASIKLMGASPRARAEHINTTPDSDPMKAACRLALLAAETTGEIRITRQTN